MIEKPSLDRFHDLRNAVSHLSRFNSTENSVVVTMISKLENQFVILMDALAQWKCGSCGGSGVYKDRGFRGVRGFITEEVPCKVCDGSGLNPVAKQALGE